MNPTRSARGFLPIADHGLVGDLRTAALVGSEGTVDWFCAPRFDSPSVFGSLLDADAGSWTVWPRQEVVRTQQYYHPDSNILVTRFLTDVGVCEVHDFMPVLREHDPDHRQRLVRRLVCVRGETHLDVRVAARPEYGAIRPEPERVDGGVLLRDGELVLGLSASVDLDLDGPDVVADVALRQGDTALFVLEVMPADGRVRACADEVDSLFDATAAFWRGWIGRSTYTGRWRERVERSALALKLLCHEPSGGIVAAPTTSLPEEVGGQRNWDYRYVWLRDAGFSVFALLRLGFTDEARAFVRWLSERLGQDDDGRDPALGPLRVVYDLDGGDPVERELDHLGGYEGSRPVRVGNAAADQLQLDVYGDVVDSVYLFDKHGPGISHDAWQDLTRIVEWVAEHWDTDDAGMWEVRGRTRPHTTSRVMCWVAVERFMRVARRRGLPGDLSRLQGVRDEIYARVMERCWDDGRGAFTRAEDDDALDAGVLLMPLVKLVAPDDPRFLSTLAAVEESLVTDTLVRRYDQDGDADGVEGDEGTFSLCSFWYVEALTRAGRHDDARVALEKMFTYANHLGLYAEQIGLNGDQLGNFPQAFTHLGLISAAVNLDEALG